MFANLFAGFNLDDRTDLFAQETTHKVAVINLTQEANSLTVLSTRRRQLGIQCDASHLVFHEVADGQHDFVHLRKAQLGKEIGLVFHGIGSCAQPTRLCFRLIGRQFFSTHQRNRSSAFQIESLRQRSFGQLRRGKHTGIMACGNAVVSMPHLFLESSKLYQFVAHHIRIGGQALLHMLHRVRNYPVPILFLQVDDLKFQAIASGCRLREFDILLGSTSQIIGIHTDFNIIQIRAKALFVKQMQSHSAVNASRKQKSYVHGSCALEVPHQRRHFSEYTMQR